MCSGWDAPQNPWKTVYEIDIDERLWKCDPVFALRVYHFPPHPRKNHSLKKLRSTEELILCEPAYSVVWNHWFLRHFFGWPFALFKPLPSNLNIRDICWEGRRKDGALCARNCLRKFTCASPGLFAGLRLQKSSGFCAKNDETDSSLASSLGSPLDAV